MNRNIAKRLVILVPIEKLNVWKQFRWLGNKHVGDCRDGLFPFVNLRQQKIMTGNETICEIHFGNWSIHSCPSQNRVKASQKRPYSPTEDLIVRGRRDLAHTEHCFGDSMISDEKLS
jgi:hypothetical protein